MFIRAIVTMFLELSLHPILPLCGMTVSCLSYYASVVANMALLTGAVERNYESQREILLDHF